MSENKVDIVVGAKVDQLNTEFAKAKESVAASVTTLSGSVKESMASVVGSVTGAASEVGAATKRIAHHTEKMAESIEAAKSMISGFGEALIAAFAIKEGFEFLNKWSEKAETIRNTASILGITAVQVQKLDAAAKLTGVSTEALHKSAGILAKNMQAAAEGNKQMQTELAKVGVTSRDYKDLNFDEVLAKIADKTASASDGIQKMAVAKKLLGRAGTELIPLLDKGGQGIKEMGDEAEKTGSIMSEKMVNDGARLQESIKKAGMIFEGFKNMLADAFAPVLQLITDMMGESGGAGEAMGDIFKGVAAVVVVAVNSMKISYEICKAIVDSLMLAVNGVSMTLDALKNRDWAGATSAMKATGSAISGEWSSTMGKMVSTTAKSAATIKQIFSDKDTLGGGKSKPTHGMDENPAAAGGGKKKKDGTGSQLDQWKNELDQIKMHTDAFHEMSVTDEIAFWEKKLAVVKHGTTEETAIMNMLLGLKKKAAVEGVTKQLGAIKEEMDAATAGSQERIDLANKELEVLAGTYGKDSEKYRAALKQKEAYVKEHNKVVLAAQTEAIKAAENGALRQIEIERDHYDFLNQLGSQSVAARERIELDLAQQMYQIKLAALQEQLALDNQTVAEKQKISDQIVALTMDEGLKIQRIHEGAVLDSQNMWEGYFATITEGFGQTLMGMLNHTTTFKQGMLQIGNQLMSQFISQEARKLAHFLAGQMGMTSANVAGNAARMASDKMASKQSIMSTSEAAIKNIMTKAAEVFANVYSAIAGIPYVGPFLAPVMAVAATAAVVGYVGKVASAEGGWERVPEDGARAILHKDEMVLPKHVADTVRDGVGGGGGTPMVINIHTTDSRGVARLFEENAAALSAALRNHHANA